MVEKGGEKLAADASPDYVRGVFNYMARGGSNGSKREDPISRIARDGFRESVGDQQAAYDAHNKMKADLSEAYKQPVFPPDSAALTRPARATP